MLLVWASKVAQDLVDGNKIRFEHLHKFIHVTDNLQQLSVYKVQPQLVARLCQVNAQHNFGKCILYPGLLLNIYTMYCISSYTVLKSKFALAPMLYFCVNQHALSPQLTSYYYYVINQW